MEDDIVTRRHIKRWFGALGFQITIVRNAHEALEQARSAREGELLGFILDINMGLDLEHEGIDVLEMIKGGNPNIYVALLTNHSRRYARMAWRLGANAVEYKSVNLKEDLFAILESLLEYRKALDFRSVSKFDGKKDSTAGSPVDVRSALYDFDRERLRRLMSDFLETNDLENICFDMRIDFEELPTGRKDSKLRSLITHCERHARIDELLKQLRELLPSIAW